MVGHWMQCFTSPVIVVTQAQIRPPENVYLILDRLMKVHKMPLGWFLKGGILGGKQSLYLNSPTVLFTNVLHISTVIS